MRDTIKMNCLFNIRLSRHLSNNFNVGWLEACFGVLLINSAAWITSAVDLSSCSRALGMQSGVIPDSAIKASSSYDIASVGPSNGRIRTNLYGGAWCPRNQIQRNVYEWLEIDFQKLVVITQVETQGRYGHGRGQEYTSSYTLEYKRQQGGTWIKFKNRRGNTTLEGNVNVDSVKINNISPPIIARKVRIVPYSFHPTSVCLRVEFNGCPWKNGVLSYSMPQGEREFQDFTYDGNMTGTYLSGGLGQLMDGVEGQTNFRKTGKKGFQWIGWRKRIESHNIEFITILFEFEKMQNFSAIRFHCNNAFGKDVRVFRKALLYFDVTSAQFQERPVDFEYMRDNLMKYARTVVIPIPHRLGRFVRAELYFDAEWMMISEVQFESEVVTGNVTMQTTTVPALPTTRQELEDEDKEATKVPTDSTKSIHAMDELMIGVFVGETLTFFLILTLTTVILLCFLRRYINKKLSQDRNATGARNSADDIVWLEPLTLKPTY